jgi:hypothetical protein
MCEAQDSIPRTNKTKKSILVMDMGRLEDS